MRAFWLLIPALLAVGASAAPPQQWAPVDQAVADLDPLATSLRRVETGLRTTGEQSSLFRITPSSDGGMAVAYQVGGTWYLPTQTLYYRVGPGFRARVDRLDYLVRVGRRHVAWNIAPRRDGEFIDMAPLGTVYELTPMPRRDALGPQPIDAALPPGRLPIDAQVVPNLDRRIDARIDAQVDGRATPPQPR